MIKQILVDEIMSNFFPIDNGLILKINLLFAFSHKVQNVLKKLLEFNNSELF